MDISDNFERVQGLMSAFSRGDRSLSSVPGALESVISSGAWRHYITDGGTEVYHECFEDFVTAKPLAGLGSSMEQLRGLCIRSPNALRAIDSEVSAAGKQGGQEGNQNAAKDKNERNNITSVSRGTSASHTLKRLKRDDPQLAQRVIDGELSAHAAAILAGFRKPSITLQANNAEHAASRIREVLGDEFAQQLKAAL